MKDIAPAIDFTSQLNLANNNKDVEEKILNILKKIAKDIKDGKDGTGAIVVLGTWSALNPIAKGMLQLKPSKNPIDKFITVDSIDNVDMIRHFSSSPFDGAIIINTSSQILGAGVYLVVEHPMIEIPEGCGTRHKAAASFSLRDDVISVLTLSEETNIIRIWKNGQYIKIA